LTPPHALGHVARARRMTPRSDEPTLTGSLDRLTVRSQLLEGNPLGDPTERPLFVYRPPLDRHAAERPLPSVYLLQGFGGKLDEWFEPISSGASLVERFDAMFTEVQTPPALLVFVDASTSRGGSQFLNSKGCGRYLDYVCDEVVPFVDAHYPTVVDRAHRGVSGKSSGGYGAIVASMFRPDVFGGLISQAGDALFECCYRPFFPSAIRLLQRRFGGSLEAFEAEVKHEDFDWREFAILFAVYGTACAYSPDPNRLGRPILPFDSTGHAVEEVWSQWLTLDPVQLAATHADALRSMRMIHLEAGDQDEYFLDLGALALSAEYTRLGIRHSLKIFAGTHDGVDERMPAAIAKLVRALQ
jgi:S-formylglutathione hydrolase FrmB